MPETPEIPVFRRSRLGAPSVPAALASVRTQNAIAPPAPIPYHAARQWLRLDAIARFLAFAGLLFARSEDPP
jgi:hypothetical protein